MRASSTNLGFRIVAAVAVDAVAALGAVAAIAAAVEKAAGP